MAVRDNQELEREAPDIIEAFLGGWTDQRVMLEKLEQPLPAR